MYMRNITLHCRVIIQICVSMLVGAFKLNHRVHNAWCFCNKT